VFFFFSFFDLSVLLLPFSLFLPVSNWYCNMVVIQHFLHWGTLLLLRPAFAAPSMSGNLDSIFSVGGQGGFPNLDAFDAPNQEIRGVVGGRKVRYVFARQAKANTNENDLCCTNMAKTECTQNKPQGYLRRSDCSCQFCPKGMHHLRSQYHVTKNCRSETKR
jgi:hypothetical protein